MDETPPAAPHPRSLADVFRVYDVQREEDAVVYYGEPLADPDRVLQTVWPDFRDAGYEVRLDRRTGETALVAEPRSLGVHGVPWKNVLLFALTVATTLVAGAGWYYVQDYASLSLLDGWPFAAAVLVVLGTHEFGHYAMSRYHGVEASLPYFIPMLPPFGTMGAVIRMKGQMPDRKALFDIGVAGPLAGLVATVVVTAVGLTLPPVQVPPWVLNQPPGDTINLTLGEPLLLRGIAAALGQPMTYGDGYSVNPVVIGGWIGMFVTFLNLIPVGQLDGGHVLRAMLGPLHERIAPLVPLALFGLAAGTYYFTDAGYAPSLWAFWGILAGVMVLVGSAHPIEDAPIDARRQAVGVLALLLGLLCFMPVPVSIA